LNSTYHYHSGSLYVDAVPLIEITESVGTPVYVYSLRRILAQWERLRAAFARLQPSFHYSLKANANAHLFRPLIAAGCGCDTVSAGEIYLARRAGCPPERIVFAGVGKTSAEIRYALEQGIGWFNVENAGELERLNQMAETYHAASLPRPRVALRINPAVQADTHKHIATGHAGAKFGIPLDEARALLQKRADYPHVNIAGLHTHIGSQLGRPDESAAAAQIALALAHEFGLTHLNLGGGFPVAYDGQTVPPVEDFAAALVPVLAGQGIEVAFEPGRYLVAEAGALLAMVQYVKNGGRTLVLDAGMTDLIRPALYSARHPIWPLTHSDAPPVPVQVVGPICESSDVIHPEAALPPLRPGSRIAIGVAGAYGMSMASNYNGRPRPAEVLVEGERWRVIRRRETFEDLARLEAE
jgi:diaminopimelate decarboxylase